MIYIMCFSMLGNRLRRWPNINPTLGKRLVLTVKQIQKSGVCGKTGQRVLRNVEADNRPDPDYVFIRRQELMVEIVWG